MCTVNLMIQMNCVNRNGILSFASRCMCNRKLAYALPEEECNAVLSLESSEISRLSEFLFVSRDKNTQVDVCWKENPVPNG
jgi:hypothetical protein